MNSAYSKPNATYSRNSSEKPPLAPRPKMLLPIKETAGGPSEWKARSVLQWVESLAIATEKMDGKGPVLLGNANLSEASKVETPMAEHPNDPHLAFRTPQSSAMTGNSLAPSGQCDWDLSSIEQQDPFAWVHMRTLRSRAAHLEECMRMTKKNDPSSSRLAEQEYALLRERLRYMFQQLLGQHSYSCPPPSFGNDDSMDTDHDHQDADAAVSSFAEGKLRGLLDALYDQTIYKLNSIISKHGKQQQSGNEAKDSSSLLMSSPQQPDPAAPMQKQELAEYMTEWLFHNWINPYPDDDGLKEMAAHCGATTQVISNWLINARTRKWRPALQQACNMERPSSLLLEDSLNIFKGNALRPLPSKTTNAARLGLGGGGAHLHPKPAYVAEKGRFHRSPSCQSLQQPPPELYPSSDHHQHHVSRGFHSFSATSAPVSGNTMMHNNSNNNNSIHRIVPIEQPSSYDNLNDIDMEPLTFDSNNSNSTSPIVCDTALLEPLFGAEQQQHHSNKRTKW